jgi:lipoyl(octanoyl) transferase
VDLALEPFQRIDPCGYPGLESTSLDLLGVRDSIDAVQQRLAAALERTLAAQALPA